MFSDIKNIFVAYNAIINDNIIGILVVVMIISMILALYTHNKYTKIKEDVVGKHTVINMFHLSFLFMGSVLHGMILVFFPIYIIILIPFLLSLRD